MILWLRRVSYFQLWIIGFIINAPPKPEQQRLRTGKMTGFIISRLLDFQSLILTDLERKYIETKHSKTLVGGLEVQWLCKFKTSGQKVNIDIM
jgi:hypothetical protein